MNLKPSTYKIILANGLTIISNSFKFNCTPPPPPPLLIFLKKFKTPSPLYFCPLSINNDWSLSFCIYGLEFLFSFQPLGYILHNCVEALHVKALPFKLCQLSYAVRSVRVRDISEKLYGFFLKNKRPFRETDQCIF
jgi:hypothetical protein